MYLQIENSVLNDYKGQDIILFGAGSCGLRIIEEFENIGSKIHFICDNNKNLHGSKLKDYQILDPEAILAYPEIPVIISSTFGNEIQKQLREMGILKSYKTKVGVHKDTISIDQSFYGSE